MLPNIKRQNHWLPNIFGDFFKEDWCPVHNMGTTTPAINVKENEHSYNMEIAAPGMTKDDFKVHVNNLNQLVISVEHTEEDKQEDKTCKYLRREFNYTHFQQSMQLPDHVDHKKISAKMCNGVLHIELPKLASQVEDKPTRVIDIK